jgi:hypothetical protein
VYGANLLANYLPRLAALPTRLGAAVATAQARAAKGNRTHAPTGRIVVGAFGQAGFHGSTAARLLSASTGLSQRSERNGGKQGYAKDILHGFLLAAGFRASLWITAAKTIWLFTWSATVHQRASLVTEPRLNPRAGASRCDLLRNQCKGKIRSSKLKAQQP